MRKNISTADRIIRVLIAAVMAVLLITDTVKGTWSIVLLVTGGYLLLTGFINFCPLYYVLGISTFGKDEDAV
jgi:hypothetical protein